MGNYSRLLSWHAAHVRSLGHVEFAANILRTRSTALHDVLAYIATDEKFTVTELREIVFAEALESIEIRVVWLAALGRVVALQALDDIDSDESFRDLEFGLTCLRFANQSLLRNQEHQQFHRLEIELLMMLGHIEEAAQLLSSNKFLREYYYGYLVSELDHPTYAENRSTFERWVESFNKPFETNGLKEIDGSALKQLTYNALSTGRVPVIEHGPKVSVLMTSYKPDREDFLTAINSILNQSWQNLELIIVDDASPTEFTPLLAEAESLDPRVRLIQLGVNSGTYLARNAGIAAATGEYMTGQDSDDWSHPQRIATQVAYLHENPSATGVVVEAIRVDGALHRVFPGRIPHGNCEVSFMLPTGLAREVGGYMHARKGADGEFRRRVEKYTDTKIDAIEMPLYLIRIGHESLSKADFKPGWSHPVRRAFWSNTRYWHENVPVDELRLRKDQTSPIPIPNRFKVYPPTEPPHYDVVYLGDWRAYTGTQRTMIDEIVAHRKQSKKVGILHLESIMSPSKETSRLCREIQAMVNSREVGVVIPDEGASTKIMVIHDPTILQFTSLDNVDLSASLVIIRPEMVPPAPNTSVIYLPDTCDQKAKQIFGGEVIWAASDPAVMRHLASYSSQVQLYEGAYPIAFRPHQWYNTRRRLSKEVPIIGRHSANYESQWLESLSMCLKLWPTDGPCDVRILGDARSFLRRHSKTSFPFNWVVFRDQEIRAEAFMSGIDFYVFFPSGDGPQEFSREALEAAASGAVVILPHEFQEVHQATALYATADEVQDMIFRYVTRPEVFTERAQESRECLRELPFDRIFLDYFETLRREFQSSLQQTMEQDA